MSALLEAFRAAGLKPTSEQPGAHGRMTDQPPPERRSHQPVELPDVAAWDDVEVEKQAIIYEEEAAAIVRQLDDDLAAGRVAGFGWRGRANAALTHKRAVAKHLRAELRRRHPVPHSLPKVPKDPAANAERERQIMEEAAARRAARAAEGAERHRMAVEEYRLRKEAVRLENIARSKERTRTQAQFFVEAARLVLSGDQFRAAWQRARDMHPDDPCWTDTKKAEGEEQPS